MGEDITKLKKSIENIRKVIRKSAKEIRPEKESPPPKRP